MALDPKSLTGTVTLRPLERMGLAELEEDDPPPLPVGGGADCARPQPERQRGAPGRGNARLDEPAQRGLQLAGA